MAHGHHQHTSASELLADWRSAQRDTVASHDAARVADLALIGAVAAEEAANEVQDAASAAAEAGEHARATANRASYAALEAAAGAQLAHASAEGDVARAAQAEGIAETAEITARDRFHEAERKDFPTD